MRPVVYNYTAAFSEAPLLRYMLNGVLVTVSIFLIQVVVVLKDTPAEFSEPIRRIGLIRARKSLEKLERGTLERPSDLPAN